MSWQDFLLLENVEMWNRLGFIKLIQCNFVDGITDDGSNENNKEDFNHVAQEDCEDTTLASTKRRSNQKQ